MEAGSHQSVDSSTPPRGSLPLSYKQVLEESQLRRVGAFVVAYLLVSAAAAAAAGNAEFVFYLVVMCVLALAVIDVHRRVQLSTGLLWSLALWGLMHMAGGLLPVPADWPIHGDIAVLYSLWLIPEVIKYDHLTHAFGFGVTTWLCWQGLRRLLSVRAGVELAHVRPTFGAMVLCAAAGMGFGALNEVVEFMAVLMMPSTNVGGYHNTGWDLVANLFGCVAAAVIIRWSGSGQTDDQALRQKV